NRTLGNLVAHLELHFLDHAGSAGGNLHGRLVRLQRDQALLLRHRVAGFHQYLDHRHVVVAADVGDLDLDRVRHRHRLRQSSSRRMSPSWLARKLAKRAASAPSITRWSYDSDSGMTSRGANSLPFHNGFLPDLEPPRMATSGALTIGVK